METATNSTGTLVLALATSGNMLALVALVFKAGRYVQRVETIEAKVKGIEDSKTDVSLARLEEQVSGVRASVDSVQQELRRIGETLTGRRHAPTAGD